MVDTDVRMKIDVEEPQVCLTTEGNLKKKQESWWKGIYGQSWGKGVQAEWVEGRKWGTFGM